MAIGFRDPLGLGDITASWTDSDGFFALRRFLGDADTPEDATGKRHLGIDWNADTNTGEVAYAAYDGDVSFVSNEAGGGRGGVIMLNHVLPGGEKYTTVYMHLENISNDILNGTRKTVKRGDLLGDSQNRGTGPHVHYEVRVGHQLGERGVGYGYYDADVNSGPVQGMLRSSGIQDGIRYADVANPWDKGTVVRYLDPIGFTNAMRTLPEKPTHGADTLTGGVGADKLYGGKGNDKLFGAAGKDKLFGGEDDDLLHGGNGDDFLDGSWGFDKLDGGAGIDTVDYRFFNSETNVNLIAGKVTFPAASSDGGRFDRLVSIENVVTGSADDIIIGNSANNVLNGGNGDDLLQGGAGQDKLLGGKGSDRFVFNNTSESSAKKNWDILSDFSQEQGDKVKLNAIDAKAGTKRNDPFRFIGEGNFSGREGELRYEKLVAKTFVYGDVDGDGKADFKIEVTGKIDLLKSDFAL